jgi:pantothenate synthetase
LLAEIVENPILKVDYIEFCNANTLQSVSEIKPNEKIICLTAIFSGKIRLIDNLFIN